MYHGSPHGMLSGGSWAAFYQGCPLHSSVLFFSIAADSNHALPRVPPLFTVVSMNREIHVGVKATWFIRIGCKREVRYLGCSGHSFYFYYFGVGVGQDWRTLLRNRIQWGRLAQSRASCWTERP